MNPERWQKVSAALDQVLDLTELEQARFLEQLRDTDPDLCADVESLLGHEQGQKELFSAPPQALLDAIQSTRCGLPDGFGERTVLGQEGRGTNWPMRAGRYLLQDEIARGGMGAVLRALDQDIQRVLAVKVLLPELRFNQEVERRFFQEAQIMGRLQHPGVPPVHELGRLEDGTPYFAMKLIEGQTLAALLTDSNSNGKDSGLVGIFESICHTLAYAHSQGILHRDLKPGNIMVGAFGEVQVMDWGLAKQARLIARDAFAGPDTAGADCWTSRFGDVFGTPAYMPPEQARGETDQLDERCDVFGLGGILCVLLTGRPPFTGTVADMLRCSTAGDLADAQISLGKCGADADLIDIARKCLAPERENRFRHAGEVADAVRRYREGAQEKIRQAELNREKALVQAAEERRRRRVTVTLLASLLVLVLGAASVGLWYQQYTIQREARARHLEDMVTRSLDDADGERRQLIGRLTDPGQVHLFLANQQLWRDSLLKARSHGQQGRKLADSDPALLGARLKDRLQTLEAALAEDEREEEFARELDEIRLKVFEQLPGDRIITRDAEYEALFRARGWDVRAGDLSHLEAALRSLNVRCVAAAALENWALIALHQGEREAALVKRLLHLARRLDPEPWRDRFRQWEVWTDPVLLAQVVKDLKARIQPPQVVLTAAGLVDYRGQDSRPMVRAALVHYPGDFWLLFGLGLAADRRQDLDESLAGYRAALAVRPNSYIMMSNLGIILARKGDLDGATELFEKSLECNPTNSTALSNLGNCYFHRGQPAQALAHFRAATRAEPDTRLFRTNLVAALAMLGEFKEAMAELDADLKVAPKAPEVHNNRAIVLREVGRIEEALDAMKTAHELAPQQARKDLIAQYQQLLHVRKVEPNRTLELSRLVNGLEGRLGGELPLDFTQRTRQSQRDSHVVSLKAGRHYQFDVTADFDPCLRIEDDLYRTLAFNDDVRHPDNVNARLVFSPARDGSYRLVITSVKPKATGPYRLRMREVAPLGPPVVIRDRLTRAEKIFGQGRFYKWHEVTLKAEVPYTIVLESLDFNTFVRVVDSGSNNTVSEDRASAFGKVRSARIDLTPVVSGTCKLLVTTAAPGATGAYTLTVQGYSPAPGVGEK